MRTLVGKLIFVTLIILEVAAVRADIIFEDNFDGHADWEAYQNNNTGTSIDVLDGDGSGYVVPDGYRDWRTQASVYADKKENTMQINSSHGYRGDSGKAFHVFHETCQYCAWSTDGLLGTYFPDSTSETIFVSIWIKFHSEWLWVNIYGNPATKIMHISHYDINNPTSRYDYFDHEQNKPRSISGLIKYAGGASNLGIYSAMSVYPNSLPEELAYLLDGGYGGTGPAETTDGYPNDGDWHNYQWQLTLNSVDSATDGVYRFWYDGVLTIDRTDVNWVNGDDPENRIWNYVWLGGNNDTDPYVESAEWEQGYSVDDFVISTEFVPLSYVPSNTAPSITPPANQTISTEIYTISGASETHEPGRTVTGTWSHTGGASGSLTITDGAITGVITNLTRLVADTVYTVTLTLTDSEGETSTVTFTITVTGTGAGTTRYYLDADGDGYGDSGTAYQDSETDPGATWYTAGELTAVDTDCDDDNVSINPGVDEITCDGIDQDCTGADECQVALTPTSVGCIKFNAVSQ